MTTPCFNPRTPCGVRHTGTGGFLLRTKFQSTHSLRSATPPAFSKIILSPVSIHALLAECDPLLPTKREAYVVSIHALLAECDPVVTCPVFHFFCFNPRTPCGVRRKEDGWNQGVKTFQSTHSLRSATVNQDGETITDLVSIHALLAECDSNSYHCSRDMISFNPRTPCGVRLL